MDVEKIASLDQLFEMQTCQEFRQTSNCLCIAILHDLFILTAKSQSKYVLRIKSFTGQTPFLRAKETWRFMG